MNDSPRLPDTGSASRRRGAHVAGSAGRLYRWWALRRRVEDPAQVARIAWAQVRRARYCVVVTGDGEQLSARVVEPFRPAGNGTIRFGTDPASRKALAVLRTGRCLLVYQDDRRRSCVTLECDATVEDWPSTGSPRFMPMWTAFWPDGPQPGEYVVVACRPRAMEIWHGTAVVAPDPFGRRSVRLELVDGRWVRPSDSGGLG